MDKYPAHLPTPLTFAELAEAILDGVDTYTGAALPKLTEKQMEWVLAVASGMSALEATQEILPGRSARHVQAHPKIRAWLQAIRAKLAEDVCCSVEEHILELTNIRETAKNARQYNVALSAEKARGHALGYYNHTRRVVTADITNLYADVTALDGAPPVSVEFTTDKGEDLL